MAAAEDRDPGDLNPGYFAPVMATGIISQARPLEAPAVRFLLSAGIVAYLLLVIAYGWPVAGYRREFLADAADPRRAFAFFTFTAASDVLAARLAGDGHVRRRSVLRRPPCPGPNGTWFFWVVGTQSVAVAAAALHALCRRASPRSPPAAGR